MKCFFRGVCLCVMIQLRLRECWEQCRQVWDWTCLSGTWWGSSPWNQNLPGQMLTHPTVFLPWFQGDPLESLYKGWGCVRCLRQYRAAVPVWVSSLGRKRQRPFRLCHLALCWPWHITDKDWAQWGFPSRLHSCSGKVERPRHVVVLRSQGAFS